MIRNVKRIILRKKIEDAELINPRFNAPHIRNTKGKIMVFNPDQEREIYFRELNKMF